MAVCGERGACRPADLQTCRGATLHWGGSVQGGQVWRGAGGDGQLQGELGHGVVVALGGGGRRGGRGRGGNLLGLLLGLRLYWLHWERLWDVGWRGGLGSINTGVSTSVKTAQTITGTICIV